MRIVVEGNLALGTWITERATVIALWPHHIFGWHRMKRPASPRTIAYGTVALLSGHLAEQLGCSFQPPHLIVVETLYLE
jgi:hypothetical protein